MSGSDAPSHCLWRDDSQGLELAVTTKPSADTIALLEQTEFGSGGLRYRRLDVESQLARLPGSSILELRQQGEVIGTYAVGRTRLDLSGTEVQGVYRGGLALRADVRGRRLAGELVGRTLEWLATQADEGDIPTLAWGCIEKENRPSLALLGRHGAMPIGELDSLLVYRQWPREKIAVDVLGTSDIVSIQAALDEAQSDCPLRPHHRADTEFFAVTETRRVVAGATVSTQHIDLLTTGMFWELYAGLVRFLPPARRRFDPHDFRYLRLSDVVVTPGTEQLWPDLLTTLLAKHKAHMAMFVLDRRSHARRLLDDAGLFGRFAAGTRQTIRVMATGWGLPAGALQGLSGQPIATGPLDV